MFDNRAFYRSTFTLFRFPAFILWKINIFFLLLSSFNSFNTLRNAQYLHVKLTDDVSHNWFDAMHSPFTNTTATDIECTDWKEFNNFMYGSKAPRFATRKKFQLHQNIYHIFVTSICRLDYKPFSLFSSVGPMFYPSLPVSLSIPNILTLRLRFDISIIIPHWHCRYFWDVFFSYRRVSHQLPALAIEK